MTYQSEGLQKNIRDYKPENNRWIQEKNAAGWKRGPVRGERWWHRRHPSIVPWQDLPESEEEKDRNAARIIQELLKSVDLKITRL